MHACGKNVVCCFVLELHIAQHLCESVVKIHMWIHVESNICPCVFACQKYDYVELFAGKAWVARCMKRHGRDVAALDLTYGEPLEGKQDAMDLLSDAGFSFLVHIT